MKKVKGFLNGSAGLWALILIILIGGVSFFFTLKQNEGKAELPQIQLSIPKATPTPFPFEELTIENLRQRNYQSSLGEMSEESGNEKYISYLTSFDSEGLRINGLLTKPRGVEPQGGWPAIVFVHGYIPPAQYKTLVNYSSYVDHLARNGFVVFKIDLRGHDKSEGEPGGAYYADDYVVDVLSAREALKTANFVNPDKIGLWGHSMAGNIVFRSLVVNRNIPAVVAWAGAGYTYEDLRQYGIDDGSYRPLPPDSPTTRERAKLRELYGQFDPNHWFWRQVTPINFLEGVKGALQVHHAVDDPVVSVEYGRNLRRMLAGSGINYELVEYPSGGHNISGSSFGQAMQKTVEFFRANLN